MTDLAPLIAACRDLLEHLDEETDLRAVRDAEFRRLVGEGLSYQRVSVEATIALREAGMTAEQIDRVGVSASAVRLAVGRRRGT